MLIKRSMRLDGHRTSLALEPSYWDAIKKIAIRRESTIPKVIESIDTIRTTNAPGIGPIDNTMSLASAVRVYVYELTAAQLETALKSQVRTMRFGE